MAPVFVFVYTYLIVVCVHKLIITLALGVVEGKRRASDSTLLLKLYALLVSCLLAYLLT